MHPTHQTNSLRKLVAVGVLTSFLISILSVEASGELAAGQRVNTRFPNLTLRAFQKNVSSLKRFGHIEEAFLGREDRFVVLLRDAHTHREIQKQIARFINHTAAQNDLILVEGTPGTYRVDYFREFPMVNVRDKVLSQVMDENRITGAEFAAMTHSKPVRLIGIDDEDLYLENLRVFHQCVRNQAEDLHWVRLIRRELNKAGKKQFSKRLDTFLKKSEFLSARIEKIIYLVRYYVSQARAAGISLADLGMLMRLSHARAKLPQKEEDINPAREALLREFGGYTLETLFDELGEAQIRIADALDIRSVTQQMLMLARYFEYVEKAVQLILSRPEREKLKVLEEKIFFDQEGFLWEEMPLAPKILKMIGKTKERLAEYLTFYDLAQARDLRLAANIDREIKRWRPRRTIVVTGGYHSRGILEGLRQRDISYVSLTPRLSIDGKSEKPEAISQLYRKVMLQSENLFRPPPVRNHTAPLSEVQLSAARNDSVVRDLYKTVGDRFLLHVDETEIDRVVANWDRRARGLFFSVRQIPVLNKPGSWLYVDPRLRNSVFLGRGKNNPEREPTEAGFGVSRTSGSPFDSEQGTINGTVGTIEVRWQWQPQSDVVVIVAHKLGGTANSMAKFVEKLSGATVVRYKSSRGEDMGISINARVLYRVFGDKTFLQEAEDLRRVVQGTIAKFKVRNDKREPKIILVGQELGAQILPMVAAEFAQVRHLVMIQAPRKSLSEVGRFQNVQHPILTVNENIGELFSRFTGSAEVILWRGDIPQLNESALEWQRVVRNGSEVNVVYIGNGEFENKSTREYVQGRIRARIDKLSRGFGVEATSDTSGDLDREVEEAMNQWFNPTSGREDEIKLSEFLAQRGDAAIETFGELIERDRNTRLNPYKIPPYQNLDRLPEAGTLSRSPDGQSFMLPFDKTEFERMRLVLMAEVAIQRALGREIVVHVGTGHVAQAAMAIASDAVRSYGTKKSSNRFRGLLDGENRPYFSIAYQRPTASSGYAVHVINAGKPPRETTDADMTEVFRRGRKEGVIAATFLPEIMSIADVVLVETEFELHMTPRGFFQETYVDSQATIKLLEVVGSLVRQDALIVIESTVQPGFVANEALPTLDRVMRDRFKDIRRGKAHVRLAYAPQRLAPGPDELTTLKRFRREGAVFWDGTLYAFGRYFKNAGFRYQIWNVAEDVEFLKLLELAWFYDLLEILDGYLKAAEELGVDAFKVIEAIVRAHPKSRTGMRRVPSMCPGGSCTPEALLKMISGLQKYFHLEDRQIFQMFQSRFLASSILQQRANDVGWKLLSRFSEDEDLGIPFPETRIGILGIAYKEGTGSTKHGGSEHVVRQIVDFGGHVEATDPYTDFWPEFIMQQPRSTTSEARGLRGQDVLKQITVQKRTDPLTFLHPQLDALVFATRHFEYVGSNQPEAKRREHTEGKRRVVHEGLDPIKAVAHMMGLEDKVIVDTYDFFSDKDYRIFLALDWKIETFGKGHVYKSHNPLASQITAKERVEAVASLLEELRLLREKEGIDPDKLKQAIRTAEARLAYLDGLSRKKKRREIPRLEYEYERQKAIQNLRYVTGARRSIVELEKERAEAKLYEAGDRSVAEPSRSVGKIEADLARAKEQSKNKARDHVRSKVLRPLAQAVGAILVDQGSRAISIGRRLADAAMDVSPSGVIGLARDLTTMQCTLTQGGVLLESLFTSSFFGSARSAVAEDLRKQNSKPERRIDERRARVPRWARKAARREGFQGKFRVSQVFRRDANGKMIRLSDPARWSYRKTVKWIGDLAKGKKRIPDKWSKFTVEVPLNLVSVEDLQVEVYEDFQRLPWEFREWLLREVWGKGKILSTVEGEPQDKLRYLMDVNLDPETLARGRGGIIFWKDTAEPVLIVSDMGDEFIVELKSAGDYTSAKGRDVEARSGRVVQGGAGEKNEHGQHVVTRVDLGALYPGHQTGGEEDVVHMLRRTGTDVYFNGDSPRALFRLRFRYPGNDTVFEIIGRASPTNQRTGHVFNGGKDDFDPKATSKIMGWNAAEILTHYTADVHIALNPDNTLTTGYYTDFGSNIDLFEERDPESAFRKYFGYYLQLVLYDFLKAREFGKERYKAPVPSLEHLKDWLDSFLDHFLESDYVSNKETLRQLLKPFYIIDDSSRNERFQYKDLTDPIKIASAIIDDLATILWEHYLPYQLLRNRIEMGYDAADESIYSTTSEKTYDPNSRDKARMFIQKQEELISIAERLIREEGYPPLRYKGKTFDFESARTSLDRKKEDIEILSKTEFPSPAVYAGIYHISFYPPREPEVFSLMDIDHYAQSHDSVIHFTRGRIRSSGLHSKAPSTWLEELEPSVRRIRRLASKAKVNLDGAFLWHSLVKAYFDAWVHLDELTADIYRLNDPPRVFSQIQQDFLSASARGGNLALLRGVQFRESFVQNGVYYCRCTRSDAEEVIIKVGISLPERSYSVIDRPAFDRVLEEHRRIRVAGGNHNGSDSARGFGIFSDTSLRKLEEADPLALRIRGQRATDSFVQRLSNFLRPSKGTGAMPSVLIVDDQEFFDRLVDVGSVGKETTRFVLRLGGFKKVYLAGLDDITDVARRLIADAFGISYQDVINVADDHAAILDQHGSDSVVAALSGRHPVIMHALQSHARLHPNTVLLLAGEGIDADGSSSFQGMRVVSMAHALEMLSDVVQMAAVFGSSA